MYGLKKATVKHPLVFWCSLIGLIVVLALILPVDPLFVLAGIGSGVLWHIQAGVSLSRLERPRDAPALAPVLLAVSLPQSPHVLLPRGQKIQVTKEEHFPDSMREHLPEVDGREVAVTLQRLPPASARSTKERVEIWLEERPVGELSGYMSQQFLPLIKMCENKALSVACYATVKGNQLKVDVVLDAVKPIDLTDEWINQHVRGRDPGSHPD